MEKYSLYLHIPFCVKKCTYCDFNTYADMDESYAPYVDALCHEILAMGAHRKRPAVRSIFIGGGTPTVLKISQLRQILQTCFTAFDVSPNAEITSEANPGTVDEVFLHKMMGLGINRISFGAQSFNPAELSMLGRIHAADDIGATVTSARRAGVDNLNLDLIYGLPNQDLASWKTTLSQTITLAPEHISLYSLTLEHGTALRAQVARGEFPAPDSDMAADMYELADELLAQAGYQQYEISNWAKPTFECAHNLTYWRNEPYLAMGAGGHSSEAGFRWWNVRAVGQYIEMLSAAGETHPHPTQADFETINRRLEMGETMMLGLRLTREGVSFSAYEARFGVSMATIFGDVIGKFKTLGLLEEADQRLRLTTSGRLLGNQVFAEFLPDDA